ncbi:hypothetical protein DICPUDRAFT_82559 [Dictyostelium purpureum]|uniref:Right handed beta helix domain-containing protein n=1 Tax=Dictyostelium purpureum TaxID=5786 RepID=F0ZWW2_DICPU|nr:uncharacterized protein DICPUDRAFT_82559 [Dictyostelium purpureum]EGC31567.1 hypothetical protein DICPUDRAFT_82559 [Dictyostelium purpureum]|eukprot:XP_003291909.1 hypothetical protein DICPUDRAFT_82559 [Dictyostelium purpureum]
MNRVLILIILFFLNFKFIIINAYYIVIDFNSKEKYENFKCGQLDINRNVIYPPCKSFFDAGKSASEYNPVEYNNNQFNNSLILYILVDENEKNVFLNDEFVAFGEIYNYCFVDFKIVDSDFKELNETIITLDGSKINQPFIHTQEPTINYQCNNNNNISSIIKNNNNYNENIVFSIYNLQLVNWYTKPMFELKVFIDSPYGFNRTYIFRNCIFKNSDAVIATAISYKNSKEINLRKHIIFHSCIFDNLIKSSHNSMIFDKSPIGSCWSNMYFYDCIFRNTIIKDEPLISSYLIEKLVMERTVIENNYLGVSFYRVFHNNVDINMNHLKIQYNQINNFLHFGNIDKAIQTFSFQFKDSSIENNQLLKNKSIQYLFDLDFEIRTHFEHVHYVADNTLVSFIESTFRNNIIENNKNNIVGLISINSKYCKLFFSNLIVEKEFNQFLNSTTPYSISLSNNTIESKDSIISENTKVILYNNSILNQMKLINSTIINLNSQEEPNENGNNGINNKNKLIIAIIIPIISTVIIVVIAILLYKRTSLFKNKTSNSKNNNTFINKNKDNDMNNEIELQDNDEKANVDHGSIPIDENEGKDINNKKKKSLNENEAQLDN